MSETTRWRTKTVEIEARRLGCDYDEDNATVRWCGGRALDGPDDVVLEVMTSDGAAHASHGDWVIKSSDGNFSVCSHDDFSKTYEPAGEVAPLDDGGTARAIVVDGTTSGYDVEVRGVKVVRGTNSMSAIEAAEAINAANGLSSHVSPRSGPDDATARQQGPGRQGEI